MGKVSLNSTEIFPPRPQFGSTGRQVVLHANYFKVNVKSIPIYRYTVNVAKGEATKPEDGPPPRKLAKIIQAALETLPKKGNTYASEFKQQVISLKKIQLPPSGAITVKLDAGKKTEDWVVTFNEVGTADLGDLLKYLQTMKDTNSSESAFPKFPDHIDSLNVILGHTPRADPNISSVGSGRFFAVDPQRIDGAPPGYRSPVEILRGYFQSVRGGTGRLLLNTNVTHGVFRCKGKMTDIFRMMDVAYMDQIEKSTQRECTETENTLRLLDKYLKKCRVRVEIPNPKGGPSTFIQKSIAGLATRFDGQVKHGKKPSQPGDNAPPKFNPNEASKISYAGPDSVKFLLRAPVVAPGQPTPAQIGTLKFGTEVKVGDYFRQKYRMKVDPSMPLINAGTRERPTYIVAEHLEVLAGQAIKAKLSAEDADRMIKFACRKPAANATSITTSARKVLALDDNPLLDAFGISVDKSLITVLGRQLQPPAVAYRGGKAINARDGGWNMAGIQVIAPGRQIERWTCLTTRDLSVVQPTMTAFVAFLKTQGIAINDKPAPNAPPSKIMWRDEKGLDTKFADLDRAKVQLVFVILDSPDAAVYNRIKLLADTRYGIHTICVQFNKVMKVERREAYFANVGLKINLKFGGINHKLKNENKLLAGGKTMVAGYDVTHPTNLPPGAARNAPSVAGLVASVDKDLAQWPAHVWNMQQGREMLDGGLVAAFKSRLKLWQGKNKEYPKNIVIFRDGVSEGQFKQVLDHELPYIRQACSELYPAKTMPRISLIVSVKRHQTRFYPTSNALDQAHKNSKSPREGTVVDRGVTSVRFWDFFLQAHASLQGTARPAHYTVLLDEIFRADYKADAANQLEKLTHDMCYLFGRATKAVSICPPAYYADLVCTRARVHNSHLFDDVSDTASTVSGQAAASTDLTRATPGLQDSMYYI
ncbi:post-transcriptional gene silencing protein QDE-2 [Podospora conica]|nr:post-transcriptional gene silencing protein QDE-2 [Schizothecium conicum]